MTLVRTGPSYVTSEATRKGCVAANGEPVVSAVREDSRSEYRARVAGDPLEALRRLAAAVGEHDHVVYENAGTWTLAVGVHAEIWLDSTGAHLRSPGHRRDVGWADDPFAQVQQLLAELPEPAWRAYGWAAFELAHTRGPDPYVIEPGERLLHLVVPRTEVRLGPDGVAVRSVDDTATAWVDAVLHDRATTGASSTAPVPVDVRTPNAQAYRRAVGSAVAAIATTRLDKVVLSRTVPVEGDLDLVESYVAGRRVNAPARSFLISLAGVEAYGFSPETVVRVEPCGRVTSEPVAGTRARTGDPETDARLRRELLSDPKEVFEHAISIKEMSGQLALVCERDTVAVTDLLSVQERGSAQHLASRLSGRLAPGRTAWDAFRALFPGTTATGLPRAEACARIRELETEPRRLYGGAVLTLDRDGTLDAALVLRALYRRDGRTWLRAGGGIVGWSEPGRELEETCEKLESVARFLIPRRP